MVFEILLFFIGAISGAIVYELFFKALLGPSRIRHPKDIYPNDKAWEKSCEDFEKGTFIGVDQIAPKFHEFGKISLKARCTQCPFSHALAAPAKQGDLIAWNGYISKETTTKWPYCPSCSNPFLICMTLDWVKMKEPIDKSDLEGSV